ncbi:hypothetical protein JKY72_04925 [Candidatus Gracilibacteria bacterium]|nr:hypothetical protein [Candidatus Gracilibacteria bacterium]
MKRFSPIIVGMLAGIIISGTMIVSHDSRQVDAAGSTFTTYDFFDWNDVFGVFDPSEQGKNMYKLAYDQLIVFPENETLKELAKQYGMTVVEAEQAINGSVSGILSKSERKNFSQEDAFKIVAQIQKDHRDIKELFELEKDLEVGISPSEIFADGDLGNSGFDLIHDLNVIEEILFIEQSNVSVGQPFEGELASIFLPSDREETKTDAFLADSEFLNDPIGVAEFALDRIFDDGGNEDALVAKNLAKDVCLEGDFSLNDFDENTAGGGDDGGGDSGGVGGFGDDVQLNALVLDENGNIKAAPADPWGSPWCPGLNAGSGAANQGLAHAEFAGAGFRSLGEKDTVYENIRDFVDGGSLAGGAAGFATTGFSASASICVDTELIYKTVSSYTPGDSCVLCEIEKINELMNETVSHSLIPNKASGNLLESAKCKRSFELPLVDMKFIAISAPVSTPPNDDLIVGNNIFEEWNAFVEQYEPILYPKVEVETKYLLEGAPNDASRQQLILDVNKSRFEAEAKALNEIEILRSAGRGGNMMLYSQNVLREINQMNKFFEGFNEIFTNINTDACQAIKKKPTFDGLGKNRLNN